MKIRQHTRLSLAALLLLGGLGGCGDVDTPQDGAAPQDGATEQVEPHAPGAPAYVTQTSALTLEEGLDAEERAFLAQLNAHRAANGLPALKVSVAASNAADFHSREMAEKNYFSHTLQNGVTWSQNLCNFGYCYATYRAENIAAGNAGGAATFTQWKNSSGHNANMLGKSFTVVGIGRAYGAASTYRWYWTTTFGGYTDAVMTEGGTAPAPTGTPKTVSFSGSVAQGASAAHGPVAVVPGTTLVADMTGTGDPDLYVRFGAAPTPSAWDCRPYVDGAAERCTLTVPAGQSSASFMVRGYAAGTYALGVSYTAP